MSDDKECRWCTYCAMDATNTDVGDCRRYPADTNVEDGRLHYFPVLVPAEHWCGEFKRRVN